MMSCGRTDQQPLLRLSQHKYEKYQVWKFANYEDMEVREYARMIVWKYASEKLYKLKKNMIK